MTQATLLDEEWVGELSPISEMDWSQPVPSVGPVGPEAGNTSTASSRRDNRCSQAKRWVFTWNNYPPDWENRIRAAFSQSGSNGSGGSKVWIAGKEVGEKGTPHIQGYVELDKKTRPFTAFPFLPRQIHWKAARGSREENYRYCSKDGDFICKGFPKPIETIMDLRPWQQDIVDILNGDVDDRKIYWYWESVGNIGKSALVKYLHVRLGALVCMSGKEGDILYHVMQSDIETKDPGIVVYDIPRSHQGHVSYAALEQIKNGMIFSPKYESGCKCFNPPHIVIFANFPPSFPDRMSADRWVIRELTGIVIGF